MTRLSTMKIGSTGYIEGFSPSEGAEFSVEQSDCIVALMRMGVLPGAEIKVVSKALAGDPIAFEVRGARIAVGKREAILIRVKEMVV